MKRIALKLGVPLAAILLAAIAIMVPARLTAQAAPETTASIHGHVQNPLGQPLQGQPTVRLTTGHTTDPKEVKWAYTFPIDATGNYKGTGIAPGTYLVVVWADDKSVDFADNQAIKAGDDKQIDFDMTRQAYIDKMTPEQKKQLEEFKKKNADVMAANAKITNLNAALTQARADNKSGNYQAAETSMTQATTQLPNEPILWLTLADAQLGLADQALKTAKASGKTASDPDVAAKYTEAETSYKKVIDLNTTSKKPNPSTAGAAYNQLGQAYAHSGDVKDASEAYDNAAKAEPAKAGMYFFNEAATLYNSGEHEAAGAAADKAIAADPTKADAYYIKGQALIPMATVDPKTQKIVAPPGCEDAYQKYLELAPDGPHAEEVKQILAGIGAQIKSSYRASKKKS
ncbi:MAG TPA: tetratricopeptide repeat protein [Granulicella sp.]|jgi:tetratricopeptide (TPR) repeat protein|nr:tetratricopeptide repeat protein [Granulicella sp.]